MTELPGYALVCVWTVVLVGAATLVAFTVFFITTLGRFIRNQDPTRHIPFTRVAVEMPPPAIPNPPPPQRSCVCLESEIVDSTITDAAVVRTRRCKACGKLWTTSDAT